MPKDKQPKTRCAESMSSAGILRAAKMTELTKEYTDNIVFRYADSVRGKTGRVDSLPS